MASIIRASTLLRPLLNRGSIKVCSQQYDLHKRHNSTVTTIIPSEAKWEITKDLASIDVTPEITGAIIPFAEQNIFQWITFPYTYSSMYYLDFLTGYMPWWLAIVGTTATVRLLFFPLVVKQSAIGIKSYNIMPQTQKYQMQINEATAAGDAYKAAIAKTKLKLLYKEHDLDIWQRIWPSLVQVPMFVSLFMLLRRLSTQPVEALITGGDYWFQNLTIPDPYFILPIMTCASMFLLIEYGSDASSSPKVLGPAGRWIMRALPLGLFAFAYNFPAAVLLFWTTNNAFTLSYALLLKNKWVRRKLNMPNRLVHSPDDLPLTNRSFKSQFSSAMEQGRANKSTMDVRRLDDIAFRKAGVGPLRKTYKTPPVKQE